MTSPDPTGRTVVVAAWVGSTNLGDELVFAALAAKLAARGCTAVPLSVDPSGTATVHGVPAVGQGRILEAARTIGSAPAMVLGGGGLLQDETSPFNLPLHLSRPWLARLRRTPFAGVGLGAGPLTTRLGRTLARRTLGGAVAVSCRDDASADVVAGLGLPRPVVAADLALTLPRPRVEVEDRVVASLRPWTGRGSALPVALRRRSPEGPAPSWFLDAMASGLDQVASRTGLAIHLVAFQGDRDDEVHRLVADRMARPVTTSCPDVHTIVAEVAAARVVVGMRYHAGICATIGGRPSVLVGYSPKVPSLADDLGGGSVGLEWDAGDLGRLAGAVETVLDRADEVETARERLLAREQGNDATLDQLLEGC
jgi:polysaccharide pyruvyl transferase CsaB